MAPIVDELKENRLRWLGLHVMRREDTETVKVSIEGKIGEEDRKRDGET